MGGNGRPQIIDENRYDKEAIQWKSLVSLRYAAIQVGLHHRKIWNVLKRELIGLYILKDETLTGETYEGLLRYYAFPKLRQCSEDTIFQQHGADPRFSALNCQYLDQEYFNRWMERADFILWRTCSPDVLPHNQFSYKYCKCIVYSQASKRTSELPTQIAEAVAILDILSNIPTKTWRIVHTLYKQKGLFVSTSCLLLKTFILLLVFCILEHSERMKTFIIFPVKKCSSALKAYIVCSLKVFFFELKTKALLFKNFWFSLTLYLR